MKLHQGSDILTRRVRSLVPRAHPHQRKILLQDGRGFKEAEHEYDLGYPRAGFLPVQCNCMVTARKCVPVPCRVAASRRSGSFFSQWPHVSAQYWSGQVTPLLGRLLVLRPSKLRTNQSQKSNRTIDSWTYKLHICECSIILSRPDRRTSRSKS